MKVVIQRCENASVSVDGKTLGQIGRGYMVLLGIGQEDTEAECDRLAAKMIGLRIFSDENGKTNLSLSDVGGSLLIISQFTLYADTRKGHRRTSSWQRNHARLSGCMSISSGCAVSP